MSSVRHERIPAAQQLEPNVGRAEAEEMLGRRGGGRLRAPLRAVAQVWVPYHRYEVMVGERGRETTRTLALDAVEGSLDLLAIEDPAPIRTADRPGSNHLSPVLSGEEADELMRDRLLRMTFLRGFFRVRGPLAPPARLDGLLYVPYWVGFYGRDHVSGIRVVDAVRRTLEGAKAVELIARSLGLR